MPLPEDIAVEIVAVMHALMRHDFDGALRHNECALKTTRFALQAVEVEIASRELRDLPLGPLLSMQGMYHDVETCIIEQRADIERLSVVFAVISASHAGVVGKA